MSKKQPEKKEEPSAPEADDITDDVVKPECSQSRNTILAGKQKPEDKPQTTRKVQGFPDIKEFIKKKGAPIATSPPEQTKLMVKKANSQTFWRTHQTMEITVDILEDLSDKKEKYILLPAIAETLSSALKKEFILYLSVTKNKTLFLTPIQQRNSKGYWNEWHEALFEAVERSKEEWLRIEPLDDGVGYNMIRPAPDVIIDEPDWEKLLRGRTMSDLLQEAFKGDKMIYTLDHPQLKRLEGN
jgi:hypothetical protein